MDLLRVWRSRTGPDPDTGTFDAARYRASHVGDYATAEQAARACSEYALPDAGCWVEPYRWNEDEAAPVYEPTGLPERREEP